MWSEGLQLHGTLGTHDRNSNSNSQRISLSFVTTDETREGNDYNELPYWTISGSLTLNHFPLVKVKRRVVRHVRQSSRLQMYPVREVKVVWVKQVEQTCGGSGVVG